MGRDRLIDVVREAIIDGAGTFATVRMETSTDMFVEGEIDLAVVADKLRDAMEAEYRRGYTDGRDYHPRLDMS